jgi:tetratricopeptide (TPR) repeat protein
MIAALTMAFAVLSGPVAAEPEIYVPEIYVSRAFGFRLELPDGWAVAEVANTGTTLHVTFTPEDIESAQLAVRVYPESMVGGPSAVRKLAFDAVVDDEKYARAKLGTSVIGEDEEALSFQVDSRSDSGTLRVHQRYVTDRGRSFILQSVARRASFKKLARDFDDIWETFEVLEASAEESEAQALEALAARCGSQIDWASSWDEAAERARSEHKLVLVTAWVYRGFNLRDATMGSIFTDPDIVELVNERFVPYRLTTELEVPFAKHDVYGMGRFTFGSAAMLVTWEGEVVDEAGSCSYGFLAGGIDLHPAFPGPPEKLEGLDPVERGAQRLRRGELEDAALELATLESPRAHRLMAAVYHRLYRAEAALGELEEARAAGNDAAFEAELELDAAALLYRLGRTQEGVDSLRAFVDEQPGHERFPEALFQLGEGLLHVEGPEAAERTWALLYDEHPDSPWAWLAASTQTGTTYSMGKYRRLQWPELDELEALGGLTLPEYEPLPVGDVLRAERDAAAWLLEHQRHDGSWFTPSQLAHGPEDPADDFMLAITAICAQSLLGRRADEGVERSIESALDWLLPAYDRSFESGGEVHFMDYGVWSRAFVLYALAACVDTGLREPGTLKETIAHAVEELAAKQKPGGGWSYYVTSDLASDVTSDRSISFTTAAVVLALQRGVDAGFDVPPALIEGGLDCLETTRARAGVYEYFDDGTGSRGGGPGSAGRGPACALALYQGGRVEREELYAALDFFLAHRHGFDKERGKTLLHTGPDGQGAHYLMFDYWATALTLRELSGGKRRKYVEPLLEVLLNTRCEGGAFIDNAGRGVAYGTGMALAALELLRSSP